jgi:signal transduction histidine kinase
LGRILSNLIKNSLEAVRDNETVSVGMKRQGDCIMLWVHGPNFIPKKTQLQMFKRFFSTKGNDRGLGLYSVRLLTEKYLKGTVDFKTSEEQGTTFTVTWKE